MRVRLTRSKGQLVVVISGRSFGGASAPEELPSAECDFVRVLHFESFDEQPQGSGGCWPLPMFVSIWRLNVKTLDGVLRAYERRN